MPEPRGTSQRQDKQTVQQALRERMVNEQLVERGIQDPRVLEALAWVPREEFVPEEFRSKAYQDSPQPIGFGQTISQPFAVAFMLEAARLKGDEKVLEIGTGSGYQTAALSYLAREVHSVERIPELYERSRQLLQRLGYKNVHVHFANGTLGLPEYAPYEVILVTAAGHELPKPYAEQLAEGGRIIIPLGTHPHQQRMYRYTKREGRLYEEDLGGFAFVPLIGEHGWPERQPNPEKDNP